MNDIKFRAYIKKLKWVVTVMSIDFACKFIEVDLSGNGDTADYDFDEIELMQYAGLKDRNGNDVYEGDVIKATNFNPPLFKIQFLEGGFCALNLDEDTEFPLSLDINMFYPSVGCQIEVIGNIYENEELMEGI